MKYSIGQFSKLAAIPAPTLRYYEQEHLLVVQRDPIGRRYYTQEDISWILFIKRLKDTGMPIKQIKEYARLRYMGSATIQQRLEMLEHHRLTVIEEKKKWDTHLVNLEEKIAIYKENLAKNPELL